MKNQTDNRMPTMTDRQKRRQRELRRKRRRRRRIFRTSLVLVILVCISALAFTAVRHMLYTGVGKPVQTASSTETRAIAAEKSYEPVSVSLIAVGDNLMHNTLLRDASTGSGYDFTPFYTEIKPYVQAADIAVINQEAPLGTGAASGYPCFNTPQACGDALIDTGFDVISHANNHAMDSGASAIYDTLDYWDSKADTGVIRIGISRDADDRATVRYIERNGLKIGFLAYTYGLNGFSLPDDNPDLVSLIDKDKIAKEMAAVKAECDAVVVLMHWGEEYQDTQNSEQEELAKFLAENGAVLIIGAHPHVCQPAAWVEADNGNRAFCIYSTGNFISGQDKAATVVEGMLQVTLTRQSDGSVVVENPGVMPLVCVSSSWRNYRVVPLDDYTDAMASSHTLAGRANVSPSNLRTIAENAFGTYLIGKTIPKTWAAEAEE